jgi:glutamate synthase (NADPH/NADH) large chain
MSGGIAYVLDEEHLFDRRCNTTMVSLERIPDEEDIPRDIGHDQLFREMLSYDEWRLRGLIEKHRHYTGSKRAGEILDRWEDFLPKFVKVMPREFRRALEQRRTPYARHMERTGESPSEG